MIPLVGQDFAAYFSDLWKEEPYEWQQQLVLQILHRRRWPDLLNLPTGTGKTSILDIATFVMATQGFEEPSARWCPRRVALVVDRRVIVDQTAFRGSQIRDRIEAGSTPILERVRSGLALLSQSAPDIGTERPCINAAVLRGGIVRDEYWSTRPDVPALIASTVDQVGSRLLFSGYGMSSSAQPIHAGLLANDTLIVLDEVHLARPFSDTLRAIQSIRASRTSVLSRGSHVMEMSATPLEIEGQTWIFPGSDRDEMLDKDSGLRQRQSASKPALVCPPVKVAADRLKAEAQFAAALITATEKMLKQPNVQTAAVIVNSVELARRIASSLDGRPKLAVELVTGRMRAYDREQQSQSINAELTDRGQRGSRDGQLVVVSTQTIEAGADFDFDGLVTECASADALVQRFGRVDRAGTLNAAGHLPFASIHVRSTATSGDDYVYGAALANTWAWLQRNAVGDCIDFGIRSRPTFSCLEQSPSKPAPVLFREHIDLWAQTSPRPVVVPEASSWLHGYGAASSDVNIAWRRELTKSVLDRLMADAKAKSDSDESESPLVAWLAAVPILSGECVSVPIWAARRWLQGGIGDLLADVEGSVEPMEDKPYRGDVAAFVLSTDSGPVATETLSEITPGCTIVVPCEYGGLTLQTWSGQLGKAPAVTDIAEVVSRASERSRTVLRLDAECALGPEPPRPIKDAGDEDSAREDVKIWLQTSVESAGDSLPVVENMLRDWRQTELVEIDFGDGAWYVIHGPKPGTSELIDEDDGASFTATAAPLRTHLSGVGEWARCFADDLGLPSLIASDLVLAGRLHDVGKADPRFQAWLLDGVIGAELVAKSRTSQRSATARRDARRSSNYPKGTRHELMSVAMIQDCDALRAQSSDWDLVCHLVAAHHGRCRPFAPVVRDKRPIRVTIDEATVGRDLQAGSLEAMSNHDLALVSSPIAVRYHSLTAKYGWYDLAYLEALLRLADHRRSEWEQHQTASAEVDHA